MQMNTFNKKQYSNKHLLDITHLSIIITVWVGVNGRHIVSLNSI